MNLARSTLETISLTSALLGRGLAADLKGDKNENGEVDGIWRMESILTKWGVSW